MEHSRIIECPSGLKGTVRALTGAEGNLLGDKRNRKTGLPIDKILDKCWISTADPGPYTFTNDRISWNDVLIGDRFYALFQIRIISFGPSYEFSVRCGDPDCGKKFSWELSLEDLKTRVLSEADRAAFADGNQLVEVIAGMEVTFHLSLGRHEKTLAKVRERNPDQIVTESLRHKIDHIDGVKDEDIGKHLQEMPFGQLQALASVLGEHTCGIETGIAVECPHCLEEQELELPFDTTFFLPKTPKRSSLL